MANIFISTNGTDPQSCFANDVEQNAIETFLKSQNFPTETMKQIFANVYLILDSLETLPVVVNVNEDYLLHHQTINDSIKNLFNERCTQKGHHTQNVSDYYRPVFDILLNDTQIDKFNKIIQAIALDPEEEKRTEAIFAAIYDKKSEQEIETAIKERDKYVNSKHNKK